MSTSKNNNNKAVTTGVNQVKDKTKTALSATANKGTQIVSKIKPSKRVLSSILLVIICAVVGFGGGWYAVTLKDNENLSAGDIGTQKQIVTSQSQLINSIAKEVGPSVVSVNVTSTTSGSNSFFDFGLPSTEQSAGTGIIISKDGLILTNRHVVPDGTTSVSVTLADGTELSDVKVLGRTSQNDSLDIAFLKIENTKGEKLVPAKLGNSSDVQVGDAVVAIGNALGQFQNTVTSGIISGYGRNIQAGDASGNSGSENLVNMFQTDAAINEGNSGGPLVNMNGQVIGVNTAIAGDAQNIGFSIPIDDIKGLISQIVQTGKLQRPFLGIRYVSLTPDYAYTYNISVNNGAYIPPASLSGQPSIMSGSPAEKAGLKEKDIITAVDGTKIDQKHSLTSLLSRYKVGSKVSLTVLRGEKTLTIVATLGAMPTSDLSDN